MFLLKGRSFYDLPYVLYNHLAACDFNYSYNLGTCKQTAINSDLTTL
jgi:hypothetical protein